jgi:DNA-binding response OmpR family regulator/drug/metabolite transporter (DMT)-like permease
VSGGDIDAEEAAASILVVDDSRVSGRKLAKAVEALGHRAVIASDGRQAMQMLATGQFDIVLLDIVMPEMDGYAVLGEMKTDDGLRDVPVIVVSSLDDEIRSVAKAIEMGAEDFLPKSFEPAILSARINASLARKRLRDREMEYFRDMDRLTEAARVIETGAFRPSELGVDSVASRNDPLGRLAVVFRSLAEEIYDREKRFDLTVRTLRGTLLVLAAGAIFGLGPALGRIAAQQEIPSLGLVMWANAVGALVCLAISIAHNGLPRLGLRELGFLLCWAVLLGCLYQALNVLVARYVEASLISLIGSTRGFMVFLLAALLALEPPSLRRFLGLGLGFSAIAAVLLLGSGRTGAETFWLFAALILPFLLSLHTLLMAWRPETVDPTAAVGIMLGLAAVLLAPVAATQDMLFLPSATPGPREVLILALGVSSALALVLALRLVSLAGPVFASQMAYSQTLAGIAWGMLLLGEQLSPLAWGALALVIIGFWLVEPRRASDEFKVTLRIKRDEPK